MNPITRITYRFSCIRFQVFTKPYYLEKTLLKEIEDWAYWLDSMEVKFKANLNWTILQIQRTNEFPMMERLIVKDWCIPVTETYNPSSKRWVGGWNEYYAKLDVFTLSHPDNYPIELLRSYKR